MHLQLLLTNFFFLLPLLLSCLFFKAFLTANEAKASLAPIKQQLSITAKLFSALFRLKKKIEIFKIQFGERKDKSPSGHVLLFFPLLCFSLFWPLAGG